MIDSSEATARPEAATPDGAAPVEIVVVALAAAAIGIVLRFVTRSPLWLDEALSVNIARLPLDQIPEALRHDGHPPLYYLLLHGWMQVFGTGDIAVRALSGLFAVVALPLAWLVGRRRGGPLLGWLLLGVLSLSPFALRYATETRMYALVILLVLAGYLLLDDVTRRDRNGWARLIGLTAVSGALLLTHYWSIWLLGSVELVLAWRWWRSPAAGRRPFARAFAAIAAGGLMFLPWVPAFLYQGAHTGTPWASPQRPTSIVAVTLADFGGGGFRDAELIGALILVLCLLGLFGRAVDGRHIDLDLRTRAQLRWEAVVIALTVAIGAATAAVASSAYASRYAAVFFPLVMLLAAGGLSRFAGRGVRVGVLSTFLAFCLLGAYYNVTAYRTQGRTAARAVNAASAPGDLVIFCPDQLGPAFSRSMRTDLDRVVYPTLAPPDRVDWVDYETRNAAADPAAIAAEVVERSQGHRIFLVWQPGYRTFEGQCEALLEAIGSARPGGTTIMAANAGSTFFEPGAVTMFPAAP